MGQKSKVERFRRNRAAKLFQPGDLIYLEWEDHCTDMPRWEKVEEAHHSVCMVKSAGFVVRDSDRYITIVQLMQIDNRVASQSLTVIKGAITKICRLAVPNGR